MYIKKGGFKIFYPWPHLFFAGVYCARLVPFYRVSSGVLAITGDLDLVKLLLEKFEKNMILIHVFRKWVSVRDRNFFTFKSKNEFSGGESCSP